jgi:hypothetical protein
MNTFAKSRFRFPALLSVGLLMALSPSGAVQAQTFPFQDKTKPLETRLDDLMGRPKRIGRVHLTWEDAYAMSYRIEVSSDGQNWKQVYSTDRSNGEVENISFAPVEAHYVRLFAVKRATNNGNSLYSFEVRAPLQRR